MQHYEIVIDRPATPAGAITVRINGAVDAPDTLADGIDKVVQAAGAGTGVRSDQTAPTQPTDTAAAATPQAINPAPTDVAPADTSTPATSMPSPSPSPTA